MLLKPGSRALPRQQRRSRSLCGCEPAGAPCSRKKCVLHGPNRRVQGDGWLGLRGTAADVCGHRPCAGTWPSTLPPHLVIQSQTQHPTLILEVSRHRGGRLAALHPEVSPPSPCPHSFQTQRGDGRFPSKSSGGNESTDPRKIVFLTVSCNSPQSDTAKIYTDNKLGNWHIFPRNISPNCV